MTESIRLPVLWRLSLKSRILLSLDYMRILWDITASHSRQLVAVWFGYGFTYVLAYFCRDFVVYKLVYFVVSTHVAFATDVNQFATHFA